MVFAVLLAVYVLSIIWLRHETIIEYRQEYKGIEPEAMEMLLCFIPVINTFGAIISFIVRKMNDGNAVKKFFKK